MLDPGNNLKYRPSAKRLIRSFCDEYGSDLESRVDLIQYAHFWNLEVFNIVKD